MPIVTDIDGVDWLIKQTRDSEGDAPSLHFGFRTDAIRPKGNPRLILTADLASWLKDNERTPIGKLGLPIGITLVKGLRSRLDIDRSSALESWYGDRVDDLRNLTLPEFAAKHGVKAGAAEYWRLKLVGKTNRDNGWWMDEASRSAILADKPASVVAEKMGIAASSVGRLRCFLSREGHLMSRPWRERMAEAKRGKSTKEEDIT